MARSNENSRQSISVVTCTDLGRRRTNNEDSFLVLHLDDRSDHREPLNTVFELGPSGLVLAVADGMGGHQSGEVASGLCMVALTKVLLGLAAAASTLDETSQDILCRAVEAANETVYTLAQERPEFRGMGTTLTAALLRGAYLDIAQVGDSRAYLLRERRLTQLTEDQTVGNLLLPEQGVQMSEQVKDMLTQAVGAQPKVKVALTGTALESGDLILICCDGLYKVVNADEITEILLLPVSLRAKAEGLVSRANENGGPDNISVVLAEIRKSDGL
ncbi:MAG TPA: protein phosphatase 2C domain-containing protein [Terriglobia bacterium]|nr:protein phosphatase 2C domain-containing protein [Terriglobia bacterium]